MVSSFIYLIVDNIAVLVILRIIHGASFGMATTATGTVAVFTFYHLKEKGEGIGYYALSYNTAMFLGPLLSLSILTGYRLYHDVYGFICIICFICTICLND